MIPKIKLFATDAAHPTVSSLEDAIDAWLVSKQGKITFLGINQEAAFRPDGTIGISVMVLYMPIEDETPDANKPS